MMYKRNKEQKTSLKINNSYVGETIEKRVDRIVNNKEPIKDGAPLIYTARKDGIQPQYNIRTDRFELAVEAMDQVQKSKLAKREERGSKKDNELGKEAREGMTKEGDSGAKSVQATDN